MDYPKVLFLCKKCLAAGLYKVATKLRCKKGRSPALLRAEQAAAMAVQMRSMRWVVDAKRDANRPQDRVWLPPRL